MTYSKPEVTVLGDATQVIQGSKLSTGEGGNSAPAYDLDE